MRFICVINLELLLYNPVLERCAGLVEVLVWGLHVEFLSLIPVFIFLNRLMRTLGFCVVFLRHRFTDVIPELPQSVWREKASKIGGALYCVYLVCTPT